METIKQVLIRRDDIGEKEAEELIQQAKEQLQEYIDEGDMESAYNICEEFFGLEPDYIMELIPGGISI
jgi:hypothetical protein